MSRNTSILLGNNYDKFISSKISAGKYNSASEVIRAALRLLESEEQKLADLRKALVTGEKSGKVENYNRKEHLKLLHSKFL